MNGNVHRIPGVAQVTPGGAQAAQGVVGNSYSNYYRMLMSYYQSLYANRNQKNVNPILNNQNLAIGAWRNRQQVTNPYYMHVDFNISLNKKGNYKYPTTKTSDKDTAGYYKDKYPGVYWEGTYKEREKYSADDKYPHHQTGYHHTKHPKNYHHDPHHSKYPTDYPGDKYSDQKHKETYANGYLHDNYQKDYKGDKYSYDHYPNDRYPNEKYIGIHAYPHHDKNPHDYHTAYKYPGEKHKETYPIGHLHDKYPNGKKGEYYPNEKYPKDNYMDIHAVGHPLHSSRAGGLFSEHIHDHSVGIDGNFLGVRPFRERGRHEYLLPTFTGKVVLTGVKYPGLQHKKNKYDTYHTKDYKYSTGQSNMYDPYRNKDYKDSTDHMYNTYQDYKDNKLSADNKYNTYPDYKANTYSIGQIYDTYSNKDYKHAAGQKYDTYLKGYKYTTEQKYDTYQKKDYKHSTGQQYDTYPDYKHHKYSTGQKYDTYQNKDYKHTTGQKYDTYPKGYKYATGQKYHTNQEKHYKFQTTHVGSVFPDHGTIHYPTGRYGFYKGLSGDMIHKKDYKVKGDTYTKVKSKTTYWWNQVMGNDQF